MPLSRRTVQSPELARLVALLAVARSKAGVSQRALARQLGINENVIWEIEAGRRGLQVLELVEISHALGADPVELLRESLRPEGPEQKT